MDGDGLPRNGAYGGDETPPPQGGSGDEYSPPGGGGGGWEWWNEQVLHDQYQQFGAQGAAQQQIQIAQDQSDSAWMQDVMEGMDPMTYPLIYSVPQPTAEAEANEQAQIAMIQAGTFDQDVAAAEAGEFDDEINWLLGGGFNFDEDENRPDTARGG